MTTGALAVAPRNNLQQNAGSPFHSVMADSNKTPVTPASDQAAGAGASENSGGSSVFRLPKFFTQNSHAEENVDATAGADDSTAIRAQVQPATTSQSVAPAQAATAPASSGAVPANAGVMAAELADMRDEIERLTEQVTQVNERESSLERVFDTLHAELSDYKNDFLYEHLKPVVRPLLFLFDSIEQFDSEVAMTQNVLPNPSPTPGTLAAFVVRENIEYFRDQLVEALQVCEVTIMEAPRGAFNSKFHKAVDVMPVEREKDGTIVRVVRSGWFLNGQLLRPAEVVVGKFRAPGKTPQPATRTNPATGATVNAQAGAAQTQNATQAQSAMPKTGGKTQ